MLLLCRGGDDTAAQPQSLLIVFFTSIIVFVTLKSRFITTWHESKSPDLEVVEVGPVIQIDSLPVPDIHRRNWRFK